MPVAPSSAQSAASRANGARSAGPATESGKARAALNGVRHGLTSRTFFLLADEDPEEFRQHEAVWLAAWRPRDLEEHEAAAAAIRAMWREIRADRLEVLVLTDLFAADRIADEAERAQAKLAAMKALGTLLRYRGRIEREHRLAMATLTSLRQRRPATGTKRPTEPEEHAAAPADAAAPTVAAATVRSEPKPPPPLNRHQRRALAAMSRRAA